MKNILILTDFSENSWNSIWYTLALFQNKKCNFYMLNAGNENEEEVYGDILDDDVIVAEKKVNITNLNNFIKKIETSSLAGDHIFTPIFEKVSLIEAARHQIVAKKIDLVVIGTNGMSSNGNKNNISPISEDIITKLKCSILVVPNEASFKGLNEIAFPTDYTDFYEAKLLQNISNLLSFHESPISFVHVSRRTENLNKEQRWNKETLEDYFVDQPHSFYSEVNPNFELAIENFVTKQNIDLIVMAAKNLNLFEQILFRPKLKNIQYYLKTPFLVLHQY